MIIYRVLGSLYSAGWKHNVVPVEVQEKDKSYIRDGKRFSKEKFMKLNTKINASHKFYSYYTFCLEGQQQEALDMIKAQIIIDFNKCMEEINNVQKHI